MATGQFALNNGVINGINLGYQMDTAMALVNRQAPPATTVQIIKRHFGALTGTVQLLPMEY